MTVYVNENYNVFSYEQAFKKVKEDNEDQIISDWLYSFRDRDIIEDLFYDGHNLCQDDYEEYRRQKLEEIMEDEYYIAEVQE